MTRRSWFRVRAASAALAAAASAALTVGLTGPVPEAVAGMDSSTGTGPAVTSTYEKRVLDLVNGHRKKRGLPALRNRRCVDRFALEWAKTLVAQNAFHHSKLQQLLRRCDAVYAAENIALIPDGTSPRRLVRLWMNSPGHRANILSRQARLSGVSLRWDADRRGWIAVHDIARR